MPQDPYAAIAKPVSTDPYSSIAQPVQSAIAPPPGTPAGPKLPIPSGLSAPTEEGAGESFLNAASPAGAQGRPSDIYNGPKELVTHPVDSLKMLAGAYNDQSKAELGEAKSALANKDYIRAGVHGLGYALPFVGPLIAKAGEQANAHNFSGAAGTTAGVALPLVSGEVGPRAMQMVTDAAERFSRPPINDITSRTYSKPGSQVAASLRSNARVDVPAEAHLAIPAIKEGLADRGFTARDFNGRNGPTVFQAGVDNALDIQEARAKSAIDPIRGEKVDPQVLAQNPELAKRFEGKQNITYGDLDAERIKMNKELRRANFYSKDPSAQYAVADPLADTHEAVNQARDLVYGKAQDTTGVDLRPVKQTESALIKLGDLAETTKNTLSAKAAQHEATPLLSKVTNSARTALAAKTNPVSAFFSYEKQGLRSPLKDFNRNMQSAFSDVTPGTADRTMKFPRYNLNLTPPPPGSVGPTPMQNLLNLSKGEAEPPQLNLTPPEGRIPPEIQPRQAALPLEHGYHAVPGEDLRLTPPPPGEVGPTPLQQLLDFSREAHPTSTANVPRSLGAAAAKPTLDALAPELPQTLREAAGLERRSTPRSKLMSATELEAAIKARKPVATVFDDTSGAMDTVKRDPNMPKHPSQLQGGHAGGGVASVEELSRPGSNYIVGKHGKLTFHGKSFAPEETPVGSAHVTVLPDGTFRVNEGNLTPTMASALKNGLKR